MLLAGEIREISLGPVWRPGDRARDQGGGLQVRRRLRPDLGNDLGFSCDRRKRDEGVMRLVRMVTEGNGSTGWRGRGGCLAWSSQAHSRQS